MGMMKITDKELEQYAQNFMEQFPDYADDEKLHKMSDFEIYSIISKDLVNYDKDWFIQAYMRLVELDRIYKRGIRTCDICGITYEAYRSSGYTMDDFISKLSYI